MKEIGPASAGDFQQFDKRTDLGEIGKTTSWGGRNFVYAKQTSSGIKWGIVRLNIFERALRSLMKDYGTTHKQAVQQALNSSRVKAQMKGNKGNIAQKATVISNNTLPVIPAAYHPSAFSYQPTSPPKPTGAPTPVKKKSVPYYGPGNIGRAMLAAFGGGPGETPNLSSNTEYIVDRRPHGNAIYIDFRANQKNAIQKFEKRFLFLAQYKQTMPDGSVRYPVEAHNRDAFLQDININPPSSFAPPSSSPFPAAQQRTYNFTSRSGNNYAYTTPSNPTDYREVERIFREVIRSDQIQASVVNKQLKIDFASDQAKTTFQDAFPDIVLQQGQSGSYFVSPEQTRFLLKGLQFAIQ